MQTAPVIVPITDLDSLRAAGITYPATVDAWRWAYRTRHRRGLGKAFRRQGRRILIDVPAYLEAVRADSAAS